MVRTVLLVSVGPGHTGLGLSVNLFSAGRSRAVPKIIQLPVPQPEEPAQSDTERKRRLFAWALGVLEQLGMVKAITAAKTLEELHRIVLLEDSVEIILAVRDALHPAGGVREGHFRGLKEGGLKHVLKNRFAELKKDHLAKLRSRRRGKQAHWSDQLILNKKGEIVPNLANLVLVLRANPKWV